MTHTPGPWRDVIGFSEAFVNSEHNGRKIRVCNMPPIFSKADARLIAAAPDLLEALIEITKGMCAGEGTTQPFVPGSQVAKARAAIAKATGDA